MFVKLIADDTLNISGMPAHQSNSAKATFISSQLTIEDQVILNYSQPIKCKL